MIENFYKKYIASNGEDEEWRYVPVVPEMCDLKLMKVFSMKNPEIKDNWRDIKRVVRNTRGRNQ